MANNIRWMTKALQVAKRALDVKEVPIGCVIVYNDSEVIGDGHNQTNMLKNPTRHAEFVAIERAMEWCASRQLAWSDVFDKSTLYVTCEPCIMCASALRIVNIGSCVYGCSNDRFGGCETVLNVASDGESNQGRNLEFVKGVCEREAITMLQSFYSCENPFAPQPRPKENRVKVDVDIDALLSAHADQKP